MTHHFPGTAAADKVAMDQVVSSVRIAVVP
jgi:hypothetical protein